MIIENLAGRNTGDALLNSSTRQFPLRVPYEGVFDFLRDFVTLWQGGCHVELVESN